MPSKVDELVLHVEAVLFASGKPLSVKEVTEALHATDYRPIQRAVRVLERTYRGRQSALEVRRVGDKVALQLREEFVGAAHGVTPVDMAPRTLKALTLIAYHQPILQSLLARMIGESAYEEVSRLRSMDLIHAEPKGATLELKTTRLFAEYFGLQSTKPEEIREFLEKKLGVEPPPAPIAVAEVPEVAPPTPPPGATGEPTPPAIS